MDEATCNVAVNLLKKHPDLYDPLYVAVSIHKEKQEQDDWMGFEWHELPVQPATLKRLVIEKIVKISHKTRNRTLYNLTDPTAIEQALKFTAIMMVQVQAENTSTEQIPPDLFDDVLGYEDLKELFFKTITGTPEDRVHFLMIGPPACLCSSERILVQENGKITAKRISEEKNPTVPSLDSKGNVVFKKAICSYAGRKVIYDIVTMNGTIGAGEDHPFFIVRNDKLMLVKAKDLSSKDFMLQAPINRMCKYEIPQEIRGYQKLLDKSEWNKTQTADFGNGQTKEKATNQTSMPTMWNDIRNLCNFPRNSLSKVLFQILRNQTSKRNLWEPINESRGKTEDKSNVEIKIQRSRIHTRVLIQRNTHRGKQAVICETGRNCDHKTAQGEWNFRTVAFEGNSESFETNAKKSCPQNRENPGIFTPFNECELSSQFPFENKARNQISRLYCGKQAYRRSRWQLAFKKNQSGSGERQRISQAGIFRIKVQRIGDKEIPFDSQAIHKRIIEGKLSMLQVLAVRKRQIEDAYDLTVPETFNFILANGIITHNSAKSLFLFCLEKLPKTKYVLGSRISRAGLAEYLANNEPRFLLVDEIDKMVGPDYAILLSLCETGRVAEMLYGKTREVQLDTIVFAGGNRTDGMPSEVISRFQRLDFFPYSETEFMEVVNHVLTRRNVSPELATYIGQKVSSELNTRDVRQALRVSKLAKTTLEVDNLIRTLKRYMKTVG